MVFEEVEHEDVIERLDAHLGDITAERVTTTYCRMDMPKTYA